MRILQGFPPNIEKIKKVFPIQQNTVFTYGDALYVQDIKRKIDDDLLAHEETHCKQQGDSIEEWWNQYLIDPAFRLYQEVQAYHNQYEFYKETYCIRPFGKIKRKKLGEFLHEIATDLSSPLYGSIINYIEAKQFIKDPHETP